MQVRTLVRRLIVGLSLCGQILLGHAQTNAESLCVPKGYTIGFFNGVFNTFDDAEVSKEAIRAMVANPYNAEVVQAELFYNFSGATAGTGVTRLQDVAETFIQRAKEIDQSGELGSRFEFFGKTSVGRGASQTR